MLNIYIAGAGSMGCRFGYQLTKANNTVTLLDEWEEHITAIQSKGLSVTGDQEDNIDIPIMKPEEAEQPADLIILFTKAMQLPSMLQNIEHIMNEDTKVLCLLNGLGHLEEIQKYVPRENILMGVTIWTAQLESPGKVKLSGQGGINLQSVEKTGETFGKDLINIFNEASLNAEYDQDVWPSIWRKVCVNGTMNSTCALMDANINEVFSSSHGHNLVEKLISEFVQVAAKEQVHLDADEIYDYVVSASKKVGEHYPSMHQDLIQNKRLTEIDYINGAIVKIAQKYDVETPYCEMMTELIHLKEDILL